MARKPTDTAADGTGRAAGGWRHRRAWIVLAAVATGLLAAYVAVGVFQRRDALPDPAIAGELVVSIYPGPASHFFGPEGEPSGIDVDLARMLAVQLGVPARFDIAESPGQVLDSVRRGHAHVGAGGIFRPRERWLAATKLISAITSRDLAWTIGYLPVETVLIYNVDGFKPKSWRDLAGESVAWTPDAGIEQEIEMVRGAHPEVHWQAVEVPSTDSLIAQVSDGRLGYALVASHVAAIARNVFLGFDVAFLAGGRRDLAWAISARLPALRVSADDVLARAQRDGTLSRLSERYFEYPARVARIDAGVFQDRIKTLLPDFRLSFQQAQAATGIEWRLLAAIAYQESQWDPVATSETGVRGVMQLTEETARRFGVRDRLEPAQTILAAARYLARLRQDLPGRIAEPDRTWLALAAFNIGMGHLEDARVLAQKQKLDPDRWRDVKQALPLLARPEYHHHARLGYARGGMPVVFVDRVRAYYDILLAREAAFVPRLRVRAVTDDPVPPPQFPPLPGP